MCENKLYEGQCWETCRMEEDRLVRFGEHTMMCYQTRSLPGIERVLKMQSSVWA